MKDQKGNISFLLNGKEHTVDSGIPATLTLNDYLRDVLHLTGTKVMCKSGDCGCCMVSVKLWDHTLGRTVTRPVNSCLCPVYSCDGWEVTTTEGIGNQRDGFHPAQASIADNNGSQCGWCTPGMVMSLYSHLCENPTPTKEGLHQILDANICRCTGYRAIIDGFRTFVPADAAVTDVEDLATEAGQTPCASCPSNKADIRIESGGKVWYRPSRLQDALGLVGEANGHNIKLVAGNTSLAFSHDDTAVNMFIDLKGIKELHSYDISGTDSVWFGSCVTLATMSDLMKSMEDKKGFQYCGGLQKHILKIASTSLRQVASWAGNLMYKHKHPEFTSDVFITFSTVGAILNIVSLDGEQHIPMGKFLSLDMKGRMIRSVSFPSLSENTRVKTYKIMPRGGYALAYVNAGFNFVFDTKHSFTIQSKPTIVFGGINNNQYHATATEDFLSGKNLCDENTIQEALSILDGELDPSPSLYSKPEYRKQLALSLFYKYILNACDTAVEAELKTGGQELERPLPISSRDFQTDESKWPLNKPSPKFESKLQASGEAKYTPDLHSDVKELHAAFVVTTVGNAKLDSVDPSDALNMTGVVRYISVEDIPEGGSNNCGYWTGEGATFIFYDEPLFCEETVLYAGQSVGVIIADTQTNADLAAKKVKITYTDVQRPIVDLRDAVENKSFYPGRGIDKTVGNAEEAFEKSDLVVTGEAYAGAQYHMHMETQSAFSIPKEDGEYLVYSTTQWPSGTKGVVAKVLGIKNHKLTVEVKRMGGAFGAKVTGNNKISGATALASYVMKRPVKMHTSLETNIGLVGKRHPYLSRYKIGVNKDGKLQAIQMEMYEDKGANINDSIIGHTSLLCDNIYFCENWKLSAETCKTNTPANTYCRAPPANAAFLTEVAMDHVARALGMNPDEFKHRNIYQEGQVAPFFGQKIEHWMLPEMYEKLKQDSNYDQRLVKVDLYNKLNIWRKRGLAMIGGRWHVHYGLRYTILISVHAEDGTVAVSHGGTEMGQGIHTKIAQVVASQLGIPQDMVLVKPTNSHITVNSPLSGGSVTTELNAMGAIAACKELKERLEPVRLELEEAGKDSSWKKTVEIAFSKGIDISVRYWNNPEITKIVQYSTYGVACAEVELDVLTGQNFVKRADIVFDCGDSINPQIEMGQLEGAFTYGVGMHMLEEIKYDTTTGENFTKDILNYHVPTVNDIPVEFHASFTKNYPNPDGVLGGKFLGEPPLLLSSVVLFALKRCIESVRADQGDTSCFNIDSPCTYESARMLCNVDRTKFKLQKMK